MISPETIEKVKQISIIDLISETVSLKRSGSNFSGLCPFHNEKSPSFHVKADQDFFHCFGCGESGNTISFAMKTQNLSFPEAIEYLANKFNIPIIYTSNSRSNSSDITKNDIYRVNALAYEFFQDHLKSASAKVTEYLNKRGLSNQSIQRFTVGFAPPEWDKLYQFLLSRKIDLKLLLESALVKKASSGKIYDTFRNRIIFPIWIDNSRIAGFGGRIIEEDPNNPQAKYLNSPETKAYQKSQIFYGLPQALSTIKQERKVYIVEGYLDVIALHQVNVMNVLATCGTALTEQHVKKLGGLATQVNLLFDGDRAGQAAAAKCFAQMINFEADIKALFLPDNLDPDDFAKINQNSTRSELERLTSRSLLEAYIFEEIKKLGYQNVNELGAVTKSKLAEQSLKIINLSNNPIVRTELNRQLQFILNLKKDDLASFQNKIDHKPNISSLSEPIQDFTIPAIEELDYLNRDLLRYAIIKKSEGCQQILKNPSLAQYLNSNISNFIAELLEIDSDQNLDLSEKKIQLRRILENYPQSWSDFWKVSMKESSEPSFKLELLYQQILKEVKKRPWKQQILFLEQQIKNCHDDSQKSILANELIEANRILRKI